MSSAVGGGNLVALDGWKWLLVVGVAVDKDKWIRTPTGGRI